MPMTDAWWAEASRATIDDTQLYVSRFVTERFEGERRGDVIALLERTLATCRVEEAAPLSFQQVGEFMETVGEPPAMFADGILPDKTLILWSGKAKHGKSLACYQIMTDVALSQPIFGQFKVNKPGPVLYIGMEDGKHEVNRRLRNFGLDPNDKSLKIYINTEIRDYGNPQNVAALREAIDAMPEKPVLIVLDTITESFDCVTKWEDRAIVKKAFRPLRQFAQDYCTVLGIIHNVKGNAEDRESGDEVAGSLAVVSSVDGYLSCYKRRFLENGNLQLFVRGGGRGGISPKEFVVEMDTETYHWHWLDSEQAEQAKRAEQAAERRALYDRVQRAIVAKDGKATVKEIAEHINYSAPYTSKLVQDAVNDGAVVKLPETKKGAAGKPAPLYGLPASMNNYSSPLSSKGENNYSPDVDAFMEGMEDA